ncbi:MAG: NusG domain II-containing protein [Ruminococcus sp.]|nr:NusG domain II-containing protein [Ruminococcus sp.]
MKRNLILGMITLTLLAAGIFGCIFIGQAQHGSVAVIYQNGQEVRRIDLSAVTAAYTMTLNGEDDAENVIFIEHGAISMHMASCPDKLCMKRGKLTGSGLPLVCLPNHIVIEIQGGNAEFDAVAY